MSDASENDTRGMIMRFSPKAPLMVLPAVYRDLLKTGLLDEPELAARVRVIQLIPVEPRKP